jgi:hypothetical protein
MERHHQQVPLKETSHEFNPAAHIFVFDTEELPEEMRSMEFVECDFLYRVVENTITVLVSGNAQNILLQILIPHDDSAQSAETDEVVDNGHKVRLAPYRHCTPELKTYLLNWHWRRLSKTGRLKIIERLEGLRLLKKASAKRRASLASEGRRLRTSGRGPSKALRAFRWALRHAQAALGTASNLVLGFMLCHHPASATRSLGIRARL